MMLRVPKHTKCSATLQNTHFLFTGGWLQDLEMFEVDCFGTVLLMTVPVCFYQPEKNGTFHIFRKC